MRKIFRRIAIGLGVTGFILGALAALFFNRPTVGWQALSVPTGSMRPSMPPGSLALVRRVPDSTLKVGDVITYTNPMTMKSTLTHRIIKIQKPQNSALTITTKGDANPSPDQPFVAGLVKGKLAWHVPYVGTGLMWAKTWTGIAVLVYLPALIIIANELRKLRDYYKKMMPYHLYVQHVEPMMSGRVKYASGLAALILIGGAALMPSVLAVEASMTNTVALSPNTLSAATQIANPTPPVDCSSSTNVNVDNSSTQSTSSGSATSTGNTSGGSATSGAATNNNSTNTNINVRGC
jgi:signal peptidase I